MSTDGYLQCHHCGCEFLGKKGQVQRARQNPDQRSYCSKACQSARQGEQNRRPYPYTGTCPQCSREFGSRYPKIFCSMKCYTSSDEFQRRIREQAPKALRAGIIKRTGEEPGDHVEVSCLQCGVTRIVKPSMSNRKFCSTKCYRLYMADRFDRWIASPQDIALPQSYDEFMLQEELPCLVEGCNWTGKHLSSHVNFAHGITADEFKRAAGFNLRTGLVTTELSQALSERPHIHDNPFNGATGFHETGTKVIRSYRSLEGLEHRAKARSLMAAGPSSLDERVCEECGSTFQPGPLSYGQKYCSLDCRNSYWAKWGSANRYPMKCHHCKKRFLGNVAQSRRQRKGLEVFCCQRCAGIVNGRKAALARGKKLRNCRA